MWKPTKPPFRKHKKKVFENVIKTCDFIYQIGESEDLRKPSKEVRVEQISSKEFQDKIAYVKKCFWRFRKLTGMGRGIAGVQVGIPEKICLIFLPREKEQLLVFINPTIIKTSTERYRYREVCMSANPLIAQVIRPAWIEVEYYNERGERQYWKIKDITKAGRSYNRVLQHEIDHLDGTICIDKVDSKKLVFESDPKVLSLSKYEKINTKKP